MFRLAIHAANIAESDLPTEAARSGAQRAARKALGAALSLSRVSKRFGDVAAADDVSLDVTPGEFVALLGPSGAGKTTVLRLIAGFQQPDTGDIRIEARSVISIPAYKRNIGVVFQNYALFPHMTVEENVGFPLRMRHVRRPEAAKRIAAALKLVHLENLGKRKISELSGGQQQRVAFARATVFEPPLLLMDEPLAALDKKLREQLRLEIKASQKRLGVTVIYVTHDQEEALSLANRIAIMDEGRIDQVGTPHEVYERPKTMFAAGFVGDANFFDARILDVDRDVITLRTSDGMHLKTRRSQELTSRIGESTIYMVRPERVSLLANDEDKPNLFRGHIAEVFYFGQTVTYHIRLGDIEPLKVVVPERRDVAPLPTGTPCRIGWGLDDGLLLPTVTKAP